MKRESTDEKNQKVKARLEQVLNQWIEEQNFAQLSEKETKMLMELFGLGVTTGMKILGERYEGKT